MKKLTRQILAASAVLFFLAAANAATVTVTNADNGVSNIGAPGTFYWAITNCSPGDTIAFNIPGTGPFFLQPPPTGFPLVYQKHRITIDGYTQPGALWNTNPITGSNSAKLMIVIDGRNSTAGSPRATCMGYASYGGAVTTDPPINNQPWNGGAANYSTSQFALLGVYRSTNVTIKGLAFLGDNMAVVFGSGLAKSLEAIAFAHDYGMATDVRDMLDYPEGEVRNCHVAGCWFGVNPANVTKSGISWCYNWIDFPRHTGDDKWPPDVSGRPNLPNLGLTVGVAAGSTNARSEFNVFVGGFQELGGEPLRLRLSGNFIGFMPDGVTPVDPMKDPSLNGNPYAANIPTYWPTYGGNAMTCGRFGEFSVHSPTEGRPMVIGTDGDGVNDADEGNLWGPLALKPATASATPSQIYWFRSSSNVFLIAGNTVAHGNDGVTWSNCAYFISGLYLDSFISSGYDRDGNSKLIIGSDFASTRSPATIAAQANHFYNNLPITMFGGPPPTTFSGVVPSVISIQHPSVTAPDEIWSTNSWITFRGNIMAGNGLAPYNYANNAGTLLNSFTNLFALCLDTSVAIIPSLDVTNSVFPNLVGTFAPGTNGFTNVTIDVYQLDPYGWTNGQAFDLAELTDNATYTNGFPQGKKYLGSFPVANSGSFNISLIGLDLGDGPVTVTANYSKDPAGTALARTMTSEFSDPMLWPVITATRSGGNLNLWWNPESGLFTVQTNGSVVSPGTWGNFTVGNVAPPVSVPIGTGTLFIRLKKL
jgi:hypothetical protein